MDEKEVQNEVSPPGWHGTVRAMKTKHKNKFDPEKKFKKGEKPKKGDKLNPYALAWSMKKKGDEPHYKDQPTSMKGKPEKKEKYKDEDKKEMNEYLHGQRFAPGKATFGGGRAISFGMKKKSKKMKTFKEYLQEKGYQFDE